MPTIDEIFPPGAQTFEEIVLEQVHMHPSITPQDAMKLCFQAAYGAEHLLTDIARVRAYFDDEYAKCEPTTQPVCEAIAPDVCRINLAAWKAHGYHAQELFDMFVQGASSPMPNGDERFAAYTATFHRLASLGRLPFSLQEWDDFINKYIAMCNGKPQAVHHSSNYRAAEHPSYRVVARV